MKNNNEIKEGDRVRVRFLDWNNRNKGARYIVTRQDGNTYEVKKAFGELGIEYPKWCYTKQDYIPDFVPFRGFADTVHFITEDGRRFRYDNIEKLVKEI